MDTRVSVCKKYGAIPFHPSQDEVLLVAMDTLNQLPLNAVRTNPESGCCGWYVWGGAEAEVDCGEFSRMHLSYVPRYLSELDDYLSLPPGFRILMAGSHVDVSYDNSLLINLNFA